MTTPKIIACEWGRIEVEGFGSFKDVKLFPSGARRWDWRETGTHHDPGVQWSDVIELVDYGVTVIVVANGFHERLKVQSTTVEQLNSLGIELLVAQTGAAVETFNTLRMTVTVAALFHSTC